MARLLDANPLHDHLAAGARVIGDLSRRRLEGLSDDADANLLVPTELELVEDRDCLQQRHAAAGYDALLDGRSSRRESVLDAVLLLLQLDLCCGADLDDGDPAGELREAFLQLLLVVVRGRILDLDLDLAHPRLDVRGFSCAV